MAVLKCKMCGGNLEIAENVTVCECEYCGTQQTLPKNHDDVITNLFNRANNLRIKCEFDKAQEIYEKIVGTNPEEAEAYWGIILCKYGIEYVEDPATFTKIPTCHRTQLESVRSDADYLAAIEHADAVQKGVYEREAEAIDKLQKDILAIVHNEKPFDVFICYKETDENGKRTPDSVIANDIYHQLTAEGFKVFYAAITLEDKLGQAYEPYIFAALNSSKVMLSIGTKPEYFNAVWVRNEWSRFLKIMKNDRSKLLIPCYKDMDAYDLPEEFSHLQAQDMSKIGFINDVIRGIKKVLVKEEPKSAPVQNVTVAQTAGGNVENLLKRGNLCLEDGKWEEADKFFEQVLNENAEEPRAYLGKLLAELKISSPARLADVDVKPFDFRNNYEKAIRFGSPEFVEKLKKLNLQHKYNTATAYMRKSDTPEAYRKAKKLFEEISKFADAKSKAEECEKQAVALENKAEEDRKNKIYNSAVSEMNSGNIARVEQSIKEFESIIDWKDSRVKIDECRDIIKDITYDFAKARMEEGTIGSLNGAKAKFMTISEWKDSAELIEKCKKRIAEIEAEEEAKKQEAKRTLEALAREEERKARKRKRIATISAIAVVLCGAFAVVFATVIQPTMKYNDAIALAESGNYTEAITAFANLGGFKDSKEQIIKCKYDNAVKLAESGNYEAAIAEFEKLNGYSDSNEKISNYKIKSTYDIAVGLAENGDYVEAITAFEDVIDYNDSKERIIDAKYEMALSLCDDRNYLEAWEYAKDITDYKDIENIKAEIKKKCGLITIKDSEIGDIINLGSYEQDGNEDNGAEPIEWVVLEKSNDKVLLLSKEIIMEKAYNVLYSGLGGTLDCSWTTSEPCKELNNLFIQTAFSEMEKEKIKETKNESESLIVTEDNLYGISTVSNESEQTFDKLFLLSEEEYKQYVQGKDIAKTDFSLKNGGKAVWATRTIATTSLSITEGRYYEVNDAMKAIETKCIDTDGNIVTKNRFGFFGIRPAMWVSIK